MVSYLDLTQRGQLPLLRPQVKEATQRLMQIDGATRRNLELTHSLSGGRAGSLLACIDRTLTAGGGRLLERRVSAPSTQIDVITARLDAITWANKNSALTKTLRDALRKTPDMDRAL